MSAQNLMEFGSSSDEETKDFKGDGMVSVARVSFDPRSSQVVGWDSIWAIIDGEEQEKNILQKKLEDGIEVYIDKRKTETLPKNKPIVPGIEKPGPDSQIDGGISQYQDYEIIIEDDRNFILQHRSDESVTPI